MHASRVRPLSMSTVKSKSLPLHIHWFRQDLRLHDNPALNRSIKESSKSIKNNDISSGILPFYCFDPRFVSGKTLTQFGSQKCGVRRAKFLLESVIDLRKNLEKNGSGLVVAVGKTENVVAEMCKTVDIEINKQKDIDGIKPQIIVQEEPVSEEQMVDRNVRRAVKTFKKGASGSLDTVWAATLYDINDLPYEKGVMGIPDTFTPFRKKVETNCRIKNPLPVPSKSSLSIPKAIATILSGKVSNSIPNCSLSYMPTLLDLGYSPEEIESANNPDKRSVMKFAGGETAGLRRVQEYIFDKDLLKIYFDTRNGMLGGDYSTKFSPWLAHGCVSPRFVANECRRYEKVTGIANKSTYWVVFELLWGCFFRMFVAKHGNSIFFPNGTVQSNESSKWGMHQKTLQAWKNGKTGFPLVDANMRELAASGFMSNRGRQNVASFIALDLKMDWRYGAAHFESTLIDHDVYANWGNWCAAAGMTGGRVNRFNIVKQSKDYDKEGDYVRHWCPELSTLPKQFVHEPWMMTSEQQNLYGVKLGIDYPIPIIKPNMPNPYAKDYKTSKGKYQGGSGGYSKRGGSNPNRGRGQRQDMKSLKKGDYDFL